MLECSQQDGCSRPSSIFLKILTEILEQTAAGQNNTFNFSFSFHNILNTMAQILTAGQNKSNDCHVTHSDRVYMYKTSS